MITTYSLSPRLGFYYCSFNTATKLKPYIRYIPTTQCQSWQLATMRYPYYAIGNCSNKKAFAKHQICYHSLLTKPIAAVVLRYQEIDPKRF